MAEQETIIGTINGVTTSTGKSASGKAWTRASIKVNSGDTTLTLSTFDSDDIRKAQELNGKVAKCVYEVQGTFKNLTKNGISLNSGNAVTPGPSVQQNIANAEQASKQLMKGTDWEAIERRKNRSVVTAYAKDLCIGGKVELNQMLKLADEIYKYVWTGLTTEERAKKLAEKAPGLTSADQMPSSMPEVIEEEVIN